MQTFRAGMPVGRRGLFLLTLFWVCTILPMRFGIINPVTLSLFALGILTLPLLLVRSRIEVAADGVFIRWLFYRRFIPFDEVEGTSFEPGQTGGFMKAEKRAVLSIRRRGKRDVRVAGVSPAYDLARASQAIEEALAAYRGNRPRVPFDSARLSRAEDAAEQWVARIRALVTSATTFRESPPTHDDLAAIVGDAHASEEHRAAAAVALAATGEQGQAHLRVAREATADPKLRVAIDAALSDDERALHEVLEDVRPAEKRRAELA